MGREKLKEPCELLKQAFPSSFQPCNRIEILIEASLWILKNKQSRSKTPPPIGLPILSSYYILVISFQNDNWYQNKHSHLLDPHHWFPHFFPQKLMMQHLVHIHPLFRIPLQQVLNEPLRLIFDGNSWRKTKCRQLRLTLFILSQFDEVIAKRWLSK